MRKVPEPLRQRCMRVENFRRQRTRWHQPRVEQLWIDIGRNIFRADRLAVLEHDANGAVVLDDHLAHAGVERDRRRRPRAPRLAIACEIAPMPPMAWPQTPFLPFTSPKA